MYNYDEQIERLTKNPGLIPIEWFNAVGLFTSLNNYGNGACCPTLIKKYYNSGVNGIVANGIMIDGEINKELTKEFMNDSRIPESPFDITIESLSAFKEWQIRVKSIPIVL